MKYRELAVHVVSSIAVLPLKIVNILPHRDVFVCGHLGCLSPQFGNWV